MILEKASAVIENGIATHLHLGAQLYVSLEGKTVADLAFGESRDGVAMRPDTLMLWMSSVKPVTAVAIAQMWERGKLELDDPVARHIPEFGSRGKERVTIRHVLTHTGGFPGAVLQWSTEPWEKVIAELCDAPLEPGWVPGQRMGYHVASGWYALAEIVRRIDGRPYPQYVREEIVGPLGMRDTWLAMPPERHREYAAEQRIAPMHFATGLMKPIPHNYMPWGDSVEALAVCRPGGSARGPIHDLGKFYEAMLAGGGGVIRPQTVEALSTRQVVGMRDRTLGYPLDRGLGVVVDSKQYCNGATWFGNRCSKRTWGHAGYVCSVGFVDPPNKIVVALVFNGMLESQDNRHDARMISTLDAIYNDLGLT
ncbi:MAG TPA: serine hydrolase domain-containing protein [Candidatus Acidoferrum sp.]|nr:serine hydrolase domain-containing protein [Candidatus Acidoferrum sp.]